MGRPATVEGLRKHYEKCGNGLIEQSWVTYNMSPTDHIPTRIMTASVEGVHVSRQRHRGEGPDQQNVRALRSLSPNGLCQIL